MISERAEQAHQDLLHRLSTTPIPTAPPRYPSLGTSVGVGLLDAALNLNHLTRRTERLTVVDPTHLAREVSLHVSLDRLTPAQYAAGVRLGEMRERPGVPDARVEPDAYSASGRSRLVWIPITRQIRSVTVAAVVRDSEGRQVPRVTQTELLPLINAGLYSLLHMVLLAEPQARDEEADLGMLLSSRDRARWLLQKCMAEMLFHGHDPSEHWRSYPDDGGDDPNVRQLATRVVKRHLDPVGNATAFLELLHHASTEYLVVAGLEPSKSEHYLSYRSPTLPAGPQSAIKPYVKGFARALRPTGREFTLKYSTFIPRNLDSFHVAVEAEQGVRIREALLITETDAPAVDEILGTLRALALPGAVATSNGAVPRSHGYESSRALMALDDVLRDRAKDLRTYCRYAKEKGRRKITETSPGPELHDLHDRFRSARDHLARTDTVELTTDDGGRVVTTPLADLAEEVDTLQLGHDVAVDDDPRENHAHLFWHHKADGKDRPMPGTTPVEVSVVLADEPPSLAASVTCWLFVLAGLVGGVGGLLLKGWWFNPWAKGVGLAVDPGQTQSDAIVAILLIVPGLLLGRLDLPSSRTLAGWLRILDRGVCFVAVLVTGGLGVIVAAKLGDRPLVHHAFACGFAVLVVLFLCSLLDHYMGWRKGSTSRARVVGAPRWLRGDGKVPDHHATFSNLPLMGLADRNHVQEEV